MELLPEPGSKLRASIRYDLLGHSMKTYDSGNVKIGKLLPRVSCTHGNEMGNFGESVDDNPNGVMTTARPGKSSNEVHSNFFPWPFVYLVRLEQSSGTLMLDLDSLADITLGNIESNFSLHPMPPESALQILVHFVTTGMDG